MIFNFITDMPGLVPAKDPALPQIAQEGKAAGKRGKRGGGKGNEPPKTVPAPETSQASIPSLGNDFI